MKDFSEQLKQLNPEQKQAVEQIDGPLLVIAGPGTGKTQLLSIRVANILKKTDINPNNILCLTFTDSAARNMRERLEGLIGQPAYHVGIHTFHSFGSEIINVWPEYFTERPLVQPLDDLGSFDALSSVFENLPHSNPLSTRLGDEFIYQRSASSVISWLKHNAITPADFKEFLKKNKQIYKRIDSLLFKDIWSPTSPKHTNEYEKLLAELQNSNKDQPLKGFLDYATEMVPSLEKAINEISPDKRHAPSMTAWKNSWLSKQKDGSFTLKDSLQYEKLRALADVYEKFQEHMHTNGLYDFDDMIMEVVTALEKHPELKLNLQEKYQYILVDEFQDTNHAQLRILEALGDNPVHEGSPNIMAVGDPNQAIYAFQGAASSNISNFLSQYQNVKTVTLVNNYRSTQEILDGSHAVLEHNDIEAAPLVGSGSFNEHNFTHNVFVSELAQYQWIAEDVKKHIENGVSPEEIAIIAPRHKYLERIIPYLGSADVPVAYERRENILEAPVIIELLTMARLVHAIHTEAHEEVDVLLSQVLHFEFFELSADELLEVSLTCYNKRKHWLPTLLSSKNKKLKQAAEWFYELSRKAGTQPMEYILDELSGIQEDSLSNFYSYHFTKENFEQKTSDYLAYLGQLSSLRQKLRSWRPQSTLFLQDLILFIDLHQKANIKIIDTNPHTQAINAVHVMTAYKSKGLEFEYVYTINAQDEVWGSKARTASDKLRLPANMPIKPAGDTTADKLRLFYVALTRAKHSLLLTSYTHTLEGKKSLGVSFTGGNQEDSDIVHDSFTPQPMPNTPTTETVQILSTDWAYRYTQAIADKPALFKPILENYKLSVTHLNNFLDVTNGGPQNFLIHNLLRFPQAMSPSAAYGDAMHKTLQWIYIELKHSQALPSETEVIHYFNESLRLKHLESAEEIKLKKRGNDALYLYLKERKSTFNSSHMIERNFSREGVVVEGAHLGGKIDKLIPDGKELNVIDFKTGKPSTSWNGKDEFEKIKLHRYKRQLIFYKLLVEGSASFSGKYSVSKGALEFLEPDKDGDLPDMLEFTITDEDVKRLSALIKVVWERISALDFPDTSNYPQNFKGMLAFEEDLLK